MGAIITAIIAFLKITTRFEYQFLLFFISSLSFLLIWFLWLKKIFIKPDDLIEPEIKKLRGIIKEKVKPGTPGKVELYNNFHGIKVWKAYSDEEIEEGTEVQVQGAEGISLYVKKIK